jgi:hypothetical protein
MPPLERQEPDRDPAVARKTTFPCAIEDGEETTTVWDRFKDRFRRKRLPKNVERPPLEPETLPEPPESDLPDEIE